MKTQTWFLLIIAGFILSPCAGSVMVGLYVFNYTTAVISGWWRMHQNRGFKQLQLPNQDQNP